MAMAQFMGSFSIPMMDPTRVVFLDNSWFRAYTAFPFNDPKYVPQKQASFQAFL